MVYGGLTPLGDILMVEYGEHSDVMLQFRTYLSATELKPTYRAQLCQRVYRLIGMLGGPEQLSGCNPQRMVDAQFRKSGWRNKGFYAVATRWFQSFVHGQETGNQRAASIHPWRTDPLLLKFHKYTISKGRTDQTAQEHCRRVYEIAHLPPPEIQIGGYDLKTIVESRLKGEAQNRRDRTCLAIRWFDRFLRAGAGPFVAPPLAIRRHAVAPLSPEKLLLARFNAHLQAQGEPAQYAQKICHVLDLIHRQGPPYEMIADGDAVALVMEHYPGAQAISTRSRVATIRRFQEFCRGSELFGNTEELGEGVPA